MTGFFALLAATIFFGAAIYINIAEHLARSKLDIQSAVVQWLPSYGNVTV